MDSQQRKWRQTQALQDCYSNFVEPYVNQFIEVNTHSLPAVPVTSYYGLCCTSGWLLLTLLYCMWMRWQGK